MPNIGSKVGFGLTLLSFGNNISDSQINEIESFFALFGKNIIVSDDQQHNMAPLSSSGLSYVLYMTDALIEGNAIRGISRDISLQMMQNILSATSALLKQNNGQNISDLLHSMCSPGGSGIKRIANLDRKGVKSAFVDAISEDI
ncbi:pyrroline-5-carboxylate reductase family protein [Leuconostoc pseudomesenteroides]